jgi:RNA polymerase sigma-70 factor (ECF subfamily)
MWNRQRTDRRDTDAAAAPAAAADPVRLRFEAVALPLLAVVYRAAFRFTRQAEDARDITQDTFLRAFRTFDRFEAGTNCKAWLLTIAYSVFVNRYRRQQREPVVAVDDVERVYDASRPAASLVAWPSAASTLTPPAVPGADAMAASTHTFVEPGISDPEIEEALSRLPDMFRIVVLLVDVEGLTYEEAATALECPVNTVRSRLFRGRKLLWAALRDYASRQGYHVEKTTRGAS